MVGGFRMLFRFGQLADEHLGIERDGQQPGEQAEAEVPIGVPVRRGKEDRAEADKAHHRCHLQPAQPEPEAVS